MSDKETWAEFCHKVEKLINDASQESKYHEKLEDCFSMIGWYVSNGSIQHEYHTPVGSDGKSIRIDFSLMDNQGLVIPVEVKKPALKISHKEEDQISSYVKQLPTSFGLLIGKESHIYFQAKASSEPVSVIKINIDKNDPNGPDFINLFKRDSFSQERVEEFCRQQIKKSKALSHLENVLSNSDEIKKIISGFLIQQYGNIKEIEEHLAEVNISVSNKDSMPQSSTVSHNKVQPEEIREDNRMPFLCAAPKMPGYYSAIRSTFIKEILIKLGKPENIFEIIDLDELELIRLEVVKKERVLKRHGEHSCSISQYKHYIEAGMTYKEFEADVLLAKQIKKEKECKN